MKQYLDSEEAIAEYLTQVLEEGDTDELIHTIGHIAKVVHSLGLHFQIIPGQVSWPRIYNWQKAQIESLI